MENASKALIIAGAILVAILLISIGVIVINSTGNMRDQVGTTSDSMAIQTFNSQFTIYEGKITGSQANQLTSAIKASNAANSDHKVQVNGKDNWKSFASGKTYEVTLGYDEGGYVNNITTNPEP